MEQLSAPERSSPDPSKNEEHRPPTLEFAMGVALFSMILLVFMLVQFGVMVNGVAERDPAFAEEGFSLSLLQDEAFRSAMERFLYNGDLIALEALWSGLMGLGLIIGTVHLWKRKSMTAFLGLSMPTAMQFLKWLGIFILLAIVLEVLMRLSPQFQTDFMEKVLATSTNKFLLLLGVGLMAPLFEEFLLRGLLLGSIRHMTDEHSANALTAGVFTLMHLQYSWTVMLLILPMGIILGYARVRSGSIWVPVVLHILNNSLSVLLG
jgi:membrane protease YdiL (CAAX protease family)